MIDNEFKQNFMKELEAEYKILKAKFRGVKGHDLMSNMIRSNTFNKAKKILYNIRDLQIK